MNVYFLLYICLTDDPHIRYNALRGDWVLVSPQRTQRPWTGQIEKDANDVKKVNDASNPLCPGAMRNGQQNPMYTVSDCLS